jgi:hypothetical protein
MSLFDKIFGRANKTATQKTGQINLNEIWYSLPTISNEFPQITAVGAVTEFDIQIHEDDYRQNEFLPGYSVPLIEQEIEAIKIIREQFSKKSGDYTLFKNCHVRRSIGAPGLAIPFTELTGLLNVNEIGTVIVNGQTLINSFTFKTEATTFYGTKNSEVVTELCISKWNENTINEIAAINSRYNLVFADWCNADIIQEK